jgi:PAS domain S-box-containing protein
MMPGLQTTLSRYAFAFVAVGIASVFRAVFAEKLLDRSPLLPFLIAILMSGLFCGTGPGVFATAMSAGIGFVLLGYMEEVSAGAMVSQWLLFLSLSGCILYVAHANCRSHERTVLARQALEQREEELKRVIEAMPVGIWIMDKDGRVASANEAVREIWGAVHYVDATGYKQYKSWHPDTGQPFAVEDYPASRALEGETILNEVVEIETFVGERREVLMSAVPLRIGTGPIFGAVVVNEDITDRRRALVELKKAKEQAEAASLAKDRFLAVLSHELRTPLTPALMLAESLETHPGLPPGLQTDAALMRHYISLEARLIDDLLDLTRTEKGKLHLDRHLVDLHEILRTALDMVRAEAKAKEITFVSEMRGLRRHINADRFRIKQVILNLLKNALKFTKPGGSITTKVENVGEFIRVSFTDTGIGLAPESLVSIFDAFEQSDAAHRQFGGLGLGLAIAKSLVELHGGSIHASSDGPGKGAVFEFMLPAFAAPPRKDLSPKSAPEENRPNLRIVLVEDHEPTAFVLARLLRRRGHDVHMAAKVSEAVAFSDQPLDLLISDIGLPDGTGLDVVRHYRASHSGFHAIALSGFGMDGDIENSLEAGFDRHLTKPVDFQTLQTAIAELCEPVSCKG